MLAFPLDAKIIALEHILLDPQNENLALIIPGEAMLPSPCESLCLGHRTLRQTRHKNSDGKLA